LNNLAEKNNFWWNIDKNKVLWFKARENVVAPFKLEPSITRSIPSVTNGNPLYRNTQIVKGSKGLTETQTETFTADGETRSFTVGFSISEEPTIMIDTGSGWVPQTIGVKGVDSNKDWYYEIGDGTVTQDRDNNILSTTSRIKVEYIGQFTLVAQTHDPDEINRMKQINGTSGIVEEAQSVENVDGKEAALEAGNSKLKEFAQNSKTMSFQTKQAGLQAGQLIETQGYGDFNFNDGEKLLITKVTLFDEDGLLFYSVEAVKGPKYRSWAEFFKELTRKAEIFVQENIGETDVLLVPVNYEKYWVESEDPNIFREVYPSETLYPSEDLYPMFDAQDRVKGIVWLDNGTELGRQEVTQLDGEDTDTIESLFYLGPNSANTTFTHFAFYSGYYGTEQLNTGIVYDERPYPTTKTQFETLQISRTDYKWD